MPLPVPPPMPLLKAEIGALTDGHFHPVRLETDRGPVEAHYYPAGGPGGGSVPGAGRGAVWVGGVGGGFDTPARGLYPRLCAELAGDGIAGLRIRFRNPRELEEAGHDVLCGLNFLASQGIRHAALTGHSFGGAAVIQAAARAEAATPGTVRTVVTLATQGYGAEPVQDLTCPILLIHGEADEVLTPMCSIHVHRMARGEKKLVLMPGAGHCLDETAEAVCREVRDWVKQTLRAV